jgi:hypothetical protein
MYKALRKSRGDDVEVVASDAVKPRGRFEPGGDPRVPKGPNKGAGSRGTTQASKLRALAHEMTTKVYKRPTDLPLVFLFRVYNDVLKDRDGNQLDIPMNLRIEAAKSALPYLHKRLPFEVISRTDSTQQIESSALEALTDQELALLEKILRKLPAPDQRDQRPPEQQLLARIFEQRGDAS